MIYQDQKIGAIVRVTIAGVVLTSLLIVSLIYPDRTRSLVEYLPLSRRSDGDDYSVWMTVLVIMTPVCWATVVGLILTSPEQEVRFVKWSKRWWKRSNDFDEIEFDTLDPSYRKTAWRYFLDRRRR